jgi:acetyltransferase
MSTRNFDRLFAPTSIAVIGASDEPGSIGQVVVRNLLTGIFRGPVRLVNPNHETVAGQPCYAQVVSLPEPPDMAIIATPAETVPEIVAELASRGGAGAIVISSGFGTEDGRDLKQRMLEAARPASFRIVGPNCLGVIRPALGINASFAHIMPRAGRIALVAQSGAIVTSIIDWAASRQIGFSYLISVGDLADVDFGDLLDWLAADPATDAILLYIEAVTHARKFMSAARYAARCKPVIAIKAGRHSETAHAVSTHTGSLAGSDAVYDAAFRRAGMLRVGALDDLFAAAATVATTRIPAGDRLAIVTNGGGLGILATDALIASGGRLATLSSPTLSKLAAALPKNWSGNNPVDIVGDADATRYREAIAAILDDREVDGLLVLNCPTAIGDGTEAASSTVDVVRSARIPVLTSWVGGLCAERSRSILSDGGLPVYETPERAAAAFMQLVQYRRNQESLLETPTSQPQGVPLDRARAGDVIKAAFEQRREWLDAAECAEVLAAYAIPVAPTVAVPDVESAVAAFHALALPIALKVRSPQITHKSDVGGVTLSLSTAGEVRAAADAMIQRVKRLRPDAVIDGFTLEPMIRRPNAHELIVGLSEDPQFGPVVLFGQGGTAVEVWRDKALGLPPLNSVLARHLMMETRIYRALQGYRDRPAADLDAIGQVLIQVAQLAIDFPEIAELDINPLLADADGVIALDARIRIAPPARPGDERLAIRPYPANLEEQFILDDGREFLLRPIRPEDEPCLQSAFKRLSPSAVRLRFFSTIKELPHYLAARLSQIDYEREMALALCDPRPPGDAEIYAVVRISVDPNNERAEYAIVVRDELAGHGVGTFLMNRIIDYATRRGIGTICGHVLAENSTMLDICRRLGFSLRILPDDPQVVLVSRSLKGSAPPA